MATSIAPAPMRAPADRVNILLVDDQPGKLLSYEAMLSDLGENLIMANSGKEALEHLLKTDITVVLMDVSMPELDGFELAEIIHEHPRYRRTAIIFVSAVHLSDVDRLKGYESGAVDYVSVPVIPELLRAKVSVFAELYRKTRALERMKEELESRVAERTAALEASLDQQAALMQRLRVADRRKDEFLALLGHELRNPLAPVRNAVSVMRMCDDRNPQMRWCIDVVERQTDQLTRLVDDLLDVSRVSQGKIKLQYTTLELSTVLNRAVETSRPLINERRHHLNVSIPEEPIVLSGDEARLTQVIANLLNNAAKFQDEGGVIEVTVQRRENAVDIRVADQGIGMPPDTVSELFELFAQGERAPDMAQGGLGIGLSLVKSLVEMHGGSVRASSEGAGRGSEFVVTLPCLPQQKREVVMQSNIQGVEAGPRRNVLVVDDNRDAAESLAALLRFYGHEVTVVHNGVEAIEVYTTSYPEVVLLDIGLPGMDGYEICRRIRREQRPARIIAMTGYGQDRDRLRAIEAGFDSHMVKPAKLADILQALAQPIEGLEESGQPGPRTVPS